MLYSVETKATEIFLTRPGHRTLVRTLVSIKLDHTNLQSASTPLMSVRTNVLQSGPGQAVHAGGFKHRKDDDFTVVGSSMLSCSARVSPG